MADNVMQKSNAALREAITNFREKQDAISALNNFEERMASYAQRLRHPSKATVSEEIARKLFEVARDYFFLQRVSELKIGHIVSSIQDAITRDNPTTEFVLLRYLVEHISALSFEVDLFVLFWKNLPDRTANNEFESFGLLASHIGAIVLWRKPSQESKNQAIPCQ